MDATIGVEVFGDCPLIDPAIVDDMVNIFLEARGNLDLVGNDLRTTYPPGMEVEVFKVSALEDASVRAVDSGVREHGTLYLRQNPDFYRLRNVEALPRYHHPELELEVDSAEDVVVVTAVLEHLKGRTSYSLDEVIAFMSSRPDLCAVNSRVSRRWKAFREP